MTEPQETPTIETQAEIPILSPEDITTALVNIAGAVAQIRLAVERLILGGTETARIQVAHKEAIVNISKEVNRQAEELTSIDARIDVVRSWLKSLGPEPTPLTGVPND